MPQKIRTRIMTYTGEVAEMESYSQAITPQQITDWVAMVENLCLGIVLEVVQIDETTVYSNITPPPTDPYARAQYAWEIEYTDQTLNTRHRLYMPTADAAVLNTNNSDQLALNKPPINGYVSTLEATVRSPSGNAIVITGIELTGRTGTS